MIKTCCFVQSQCLQGSVLLNIAAFRTPARSLGLITRRTSRRLIAGTKKMRCSESFFAPSQRLLWFGIVQLPTATRFPLPQRRVLPARLTSPTSVRRGEETSPAAVVEISPATCSVVSRFAVPRVPADAKCTCAIFTERDDVKGTTTFKLCRSNRRGSVRQCRCTVHKPLVLSSCGASVSHRPPLDGRGTALCCLPALGTRTLLLRPLWGLLAAPPIHL